MMSTSDKHGFKALPSVTVCTYDGRSCKTFAMSWCVCIMSTVAKLYHVTVCLFNELGCKTFPSVTVCAHVWTQLQDLA